MGLTASKLNATPPPKKVQIDVETAQARYRIDGTDPTSAVGIILNPLDGLTIEGLKNMKNFKAIRTGSTSATLRATYFK